MKQKPTLTGLAIWMISGGLMALAIYGLWAYRSEAGSGAGSPDPERVRGIVHAWCYRQLDKLPGRSLNETQQGVMCDCVSRMFVERGGMSLTLDPQSPDYDPVPVQALLNEIGGSCHSSAVWLGTAPEPGGPQAGVP